MLWLPRGTPEADKAMYDLQYIVLPTGRATVAKVVKLYHETPDHIVAPRHYLDLASTPTHYRGPKDFPTVAEHCAIVPRDQLQVDAIQFLRDAGTLPPGQSDAIVSLRCGEGKMYIALKAAVEYGRWTLVVAHTKDILEQWTEVILKETSIKRVGRVISGDLDLQPFTVALVQSVLALDETNKRMLGEIYGCIIMDEMHHLAAPVFSGVANAFPGRRIGLSATLAREDYLSFVYYHALSKNVFYRDSTRAKASVFFRLVRMDDLLLDDNYAVAVTQLAESEQYLGVLETDIREGYRQLRKQLIISSRRQVLLNLRDRLHDLAPGINIMETPADVRLANLRTKPITLAIELFGKEGLSEPSLDTLRVVTPMKDRNAVVQTVGRLEREGGQEPQAWFYAARHPAFIRTLNKTMESLTVSGYRVQKDV